MFGCEFGKKVIVKFRKMVSQIESNVMMSESMKCIRIGNESTQLDKRKALNRITSSRCTLLSFLPLALLNQLRRFAISYFIIMTIIAFFLKDCSISPLVSLIPLVIVLSAALTKEGLETYFVSRAENSLNTLKVNVIRNNANETIECQDIEPGELVFIQRNQYVPCDLVLMKTSNEKIDYCYVRTANLNGKTELKCLKVPESVFALSQIDCRSQGSIECPTTHSHSFTGKLTINTEFDTKVSLLNEQNLLLNGMQLKDCDYVIGCAVFLGTDTKMRQFCPQRRRKISKSEKYINAYIIGMILFLLICAMILYLLERYDEVSVMPSTFYLGSPFEPNNFLQILDQYFSLLFLLIYMIPLSFYVILEIYRIAGYWYLRSDLHFYDATTEQTLIANTSDLNEELGQIDILFADKTGTLTENKMTLNACSIMGRRFQCHDAYLVDSLDGSNIDLSQFDANQINFFEALSICHTVSVSKKHSGNSNSQSSDFVLDINDPEDDGVSCLGNNLPNYETNNQDESALVEASAKLGIVLIDTDDGNLKLQLNSEAPMKKCDFTYERLQVLKYTAQRKRMSVVVRDENNILWLYTKGAVESVMMTLSRNDNQEALLVKSIEDARHFAKNGLRTLAIARKRLDYEEYDEFLRTLEDGSSQMEFNVEKCFSKLETNLELLGVTAIEDEMQAGVGETVAALKRAGIQMWILTGDRIETTLNVAIACGHVSSSSTLHSITNCKSKDELLQQINALKRLQTLKTECCLIIDNESLSLVLEVLPNEFRDVALECDAVLCCLLTPAQKAQVVKLIKDASQKYRTAAIGDGANDVLMMQEADVAIGLIGNEGREAVHHSDYSIAKFAMLKRLLLVHGHYNTKRLGILLMYYFYENILTTLSLLLFQFYTMHSGTSLFDSLYLALYTSLYNILPGIVISITEKPYSEDILMSFPELYRKSRKYRPLNWLQFLIWIVVGIFHGAQIYYTAFFMLSNNNVILTGGQTAGLSCFGTMIMSAIVLISNLKICLEVRYLSYWLVGSIIFSLFMFFLSTMLDNITNILSDPLMYWSYINLLESIPFWLYTIAIVVICLMPDFGLRYLRDSFRLPKEWSITQSAFVHLLQEYDIIKPEDHHSLS